MTKQDEKTKETAPVKKEDTKEVSKDEATKSEVEKKEGESEKTKETTSSSSDGKEDNSEKAKDDDKKDDAAEDEDDEAEESEEDEDTNEGEEAAQEGGKKPFNRQGARGQRRFTSFNRSGNKAVFHQSNDKSDPSCRVYIGNLSWDVTWRELKDHMKKTGCEVTRADVLASPDGRSKGCGIVEFATAEGASRAVLTLNNTELMGRQIFVREDREDGSGSGYYTQQTRSAGGGESVNTSTGRQASSGDAQSRRVYVGNLSWDVAWQDLKDHMRGVGVVNHAEVMKEADGRSKGCGIVEFATAEEAKEAINTLNDSELKGRMIFVREDRETTSGGQHAGAYRGGSAAVYVGNLAYETSWQDLKDHMRQAGNVDQANILQEEGGRSKGCGIVVYQNPRDAQRAIRELQESVLDGRPIFVREDREQGSRSGGGPSSSGARGGFRTGGGYNNNATGGSQLYVTNISSATSWRELKDHFSQCGDVVRAEVMGANDNKKRGTVKFAKSKDASTAIQRLNGSELQGSTLEVRFDKRAR